MRPDIIRGIVQDPQYHRLEVMKSSELYRPELEIINLIEKHIALQTGKIIVVRSARQTCKNESSAMICIRALHIYQNRGGTYIRTAPTWKPQIVNSMKRVERFIKQDKIIRRHYRSRWGYIYQYGNAEIQFLSSDKKANVEGATADICLDVDEAHKVDQGKFEEAFSPMTASTSAPIVMWGVAADKQDLLYEYRQHNLEHNPDCVLEYPAHIWCEISPHYARHYEERRNKLGAEHPVILTQYDLVEVEATGAYFSKYQQTNILSGDHEQYSVPKPDKEYVIQIDIAGEDEDEETDPLKKSEGRRDSTVALVWEVDWDDIVNDFPMCRLVNIYWWVGKTLSDSPSGLPGQQSILLDLLNTWQPHKAVIDARGVGEQIAKYLNKGYGDSAEAYAASDDSVSKDCYGLHAMVNNSRVKVFRNNGSSEYKEIVRQTERTGYEIKKHDKMKIVKPHGKGHIDMVKAMTYLPRTIADYSELIRFL